MKNHHSVFCDYRSKQKNVFTAPQDYLTTNLALLGLFTLYQQQECLSRGLLRSDHHIISKLEDTCIYIPTAKLTVGDKPPLTILSMSTHSLHSKLPSAPPRSRMDAVSRHCSPVGTNNPHYRSMLAGICLCVVSVNHIGLTLLRCLDVYNNYLTA